MIDKPIIRSILDQDAYKIKMACAIRKNFNGPQVKWRFIHRGSHSFKKFPIDRLREEIQAMAQLKLTKNEKLWLEKEFGEEFGATDFFDWFGKYRFNPEEVQYGLKDGQLSLEIEGDWERTTFWEVPLMALISELYFKYVDTNWEHRKEEWVRRFIDKTTIKAENTYPDRMKIRWADFGTRRRRSQDVQETLQDDAIGHLFCYMGTSNLDLARRMEIPAIGTVAHEWYMGNYGTIKRYWGGTNLEKRANDRALLDWINVFEGRNGIALTDTFTTNKFLKSFNWSVAKIYDGLRQDSGDPKKWLDKIVAHYEKLGINPSTKKYVFSDGLTFAKAHEINQYTLNKHSLGWGDEINFGIGTNFTNDFEGSPPLNMVIKMVEFEGVPVYKLSDESGKSTKPKKVAKV